MRNVLFCNRFFFLIFALFCAAGLAGCAGGSPASPVTRTGFAFDTVISITIYDPDKTDALDTCLALCQEYETLLSAALEGSEIWRINHAGREAVEVSHDTASLIQAALSYCEMSRGLLDLTLGPVSAEWNISGQMEQASQTAGYAYYIPSDDTLSALMEHVSYQNVLLTDKNGREIGYHEPLSKNNIYYVSLSDDRSAIDLGFIAKGYIADCLKSYLLSEGIESGIINLGGNILLIGARPDGSCFNVGIRKPFADGETIATVKECDVSIVSSGCYERYFIPDSEKKDGMICHHILDTATGYPIQNDLLGVTVISGSSLQGDALSTYCYILGLEKGLEYIRGLEDVEAVFVTKDFETVTTY